MHFRSTVTALNAAQELGKYRKRCNTGRQLQLEEYTNTTHHSPPQLLASKGELEALSASIKAFGLTLRERDGAKGWTLLHHATSTNQVTAMDLLIKAGIELDAADKDGNTALHVATICSHIDAIHFLLDSGADSRVANKEVDTPLHIAAREKTGKVLEAFLCHDDIDYSVNGFRNRNILHTISEVDNMEACKVLRERVMKEEAAKRFRLCSRDDDGLTPIHLAARRNSHMVLEHFLQTTTDHGYSVKDVFSFIDEENSTPLHAAVEGGNFEVLRVLLKYGACPLIMKESLPPPLHLACSQGKLDMVRAMVDSVGKHILHQADQFKRTPLHYCAFSIHSNSIISYIIEDGEADACINQQDKNGRTPLHMSISSGNLAGVKELLARGADPSTKDNDGHNALHFAVLHDRKAIVNALLETDSSDELIMEMNEKGFSPIHIGLKLGRRDVISALIMSIELQSTSSIKDACGNNYFHLAASSGDWKALSAFLNLLNAHKFLNETNNCGSTPLHGAAKNGHAHCIELLLNSGAMVHKCHKGISPLMLACQGGHIKCVKLLHKAHPFQMDWQDDNGDTALHYAATSSNPSMVQKVLDLGSQIMHNDRGESFFDIIISRKDRDCALAVINHKRWQECLDVVSPVLESPMLRLVTHMPTTAKVVLDRCHTKKSSSPEESLQTFNFKYLLSLDNDDQLSAVKSEVIENPAPFTLQRNKSRRGFMETITGPDGINTDAATLTLRRQNHSKTSLKTNRTPAAAAAAESLKKKKKISPTMEVLNRILQHKRMELLVHPVVSAFLKRKWKSYGRYMYGAFMLLAILHAAFLSAFAIVGQKASLEDPDPNSTYNYTEADETTAHHTNVTLQILRWFTVFLNTLLAFSEVADVYMYGRKFLTKIDAWIGISTVISNYIFLLAPDPFSINIRPFGAAACFFTWLELFAALQALEILGIYVNMFFRILQTVFNVLFICGFLLVAFALSLYILTDNSITEFSTISFSLFSVFGYMLGEIQYSLFINKASESEPEMPFVHSSLILTLVFVLAIMMSIVMANLLIGLAVGDIEQIKLNAIYEKRAVMINYFCRIDNAIPHCLQQRITHYTHTAHSKKWKHFDFLRETLVSLRLEIQNTPLESTESSSTQKAPIDMATELSEIKHKLQEMMEMVITFQEDENTYCHKRRQKFRWQRPQSSMSVSSDMTVSDFLQDIA